jgi:HAD superfamily hydrolase (TIGR01509 family)
LSKGEGDGEVRAVCFDLDGTLIRSEEIRDGVRRAYVADAGGVWSPGADRDMTGMHLLGWARYMHDRLGVRRSPAHIARDLEARIEAIYREGIPLVAGAREALARCAAVWPLALATGSTRRLIELVLDGGGLREFFRVTVSVDDVAAAKPSPDVYLRAAALLATDPTHCVAVEDSANGVVSAYAAGMGVVAIASPVLAAEVMPPVIGASIDRLANLSPDIIRRAARPVVPRPSTSSG